jgi:signal transduction histidine kinase
MSFKDKILHGRIFSARRRTVAIAIGLALVMLSISYTWKVSTDMQHEDEAAIQQLRESEYNDVEMWEDILRSSRYIFNEPQLLKELAEHTTIPFVITDDALTPLISNLPEELLDNAELLREQIMAMSLVNQPVTVSYRIPPVNFTIYYGTTNYSSLVSNAHSEALLYFPYVQLIIICVFAIFAYIAFMSTKQNEQNRVWVGLAKETAHQLGTPTSSLLGWVEYLRGQPVDQMAVDEMQKDLAHLMKIVDRFSKIGSESPLTTASLNNVVGSAVMYFRKRVPRNVTIEYNGLAINTINANINEALFEWVIENLLKNALDALQGRGVIDVKISCDEKYAYVDISDTGKGIPKSKWKSIFEPGYTTKTRGWGLGLSLSRRVIEEYHKGRISVLSSVIGRGTTFRIALKRV